MTSTLIKAQYRNLAPQGNREAPTKTRPKSGFGLNALFLGSLFLLSAQGILNVAFRGTPLVVWKQVLLYSLLPIALVSFRAGSNYVVRITLSLSLILIVGSYFQGISLLNIAQNILYYAGWLPFYIWGRSGSSRSNNLERFSFYFIIISGAGLIIQLYTPYLNFLKDDIAAIQYRAQFGEAQRLALYFVASTIALPTLASFFYIVVTGSLNNGAERNLRILVSIPFLVMATLPTGSLSAFASLAFCLVSAIYALRIPITTRFIIFISGALISLFIYEYVLDMIDPIATAQLKRVLTNNQYSDSNRGRLTLWAEAWNNITDFDLIKHITGAGLGVTVSSRIALSTYMHGESTFFQAYIEGGICGLFLRLMPFSIITYYGFMRKNVALIIIAISNGFACAVAPVFSGFGIECTMGLIAGMAKLEKVGE